MQKLNFDERKKTFKKISFATHSTANLQFLPILKNSIFFFKKTSIFHKT